MKRATSLLLVLGMLAVFAAGCSRGAQADEARFCELIGLYNQGNGYEPPADGSPEAMADALRAYLQLPEVEAILAEIGQVAPDEVRDDVRVMLRTTEALVDDPSATLDETFESPEAAEANGRIVAYTGEQCAADEGDGDDEEAGMDPATDPVDEDGDEDGDENDGTEA